MSPEIKLEDAFQARIDDEQKIEPKDWMPEKYRKTLYPTDITACAL